MLLTPAYNGFGDHPMNNFRHGQQTNNTNRQENAFLSDTILDTYFTRLHGKPFYILEESSTRQKHHMGQLPGPLMMAIYAITIRYSLRLSPLISRPWSLTFYILDMLNPRKGKKAQHESDSNMRWKHDRKSILTIRRLKDFKHSYYCPWSFLPMD